MRRLGLPLVLLLLARAMAQTLPPQPTELGVIDLSREPYLIHADARSDVTVALQSALADYAGKGRILYLPAGTYRVSETIRFGTPGGNTELVGAGAAKTILQLRDHAIGFADPQKPQPVLSNLPKTPRPSATVVNLWGAAIRDIGVDVGLGNPGAIAIEFHGNEVARLDGVRLVCRDDRPAAVGISMEKSSAGPCLLKNVAVSGFAQGVALSGSKACATLSDITIEQCGIGVRNSRGVASIEKLRASSCRLPVQNTDALSVLAIDDAQLTGLSGVTGPVAIDNQGVLRLFNVGASGFSRLTQAHEGTRTADWASANPRRLGAAVPPAQANPAVGPTTRPQIAKLRNVRDFGARGDGRTDDSAAIQRALDSGGTAIAFPSGEYRLESPLRVGPRVREIHGLKSQWVLGPGLRKGEPVLRVAPGDDSLDISRLNLGFGAGDILTLSIDSRPVTLTDSLFGRIEAQGAATRLEIENSRLGAIEARGASISGRQVCLVGRGPNLKLQGGRAILLGVTALSASTLLDASADARVWIAGGAVFPMEKVADDVPLVVSRGATVELSLVGPPRQKEGLHAVAARQIVGSARKTIYASDLRAGSHRDLELPDLAIYPR